MSITSTRPLKNDENEGFEVDFDENVDAANVRGVYLQNDSSDDSNVIITRNSENNIAFTDSISGTYTLAELASRLTANQHRAIRQLIHFIDDGPAEGFTSGAYREVITSGILPTSIIWWVNSEKIDKIVEKTITYTGILPTQIQWKMYDTDGETVLSTVTDSITYDNIMETNRTRTIVI